MSLGPTFRIVYHVPGEQGRCEVVVAGDGTCTYLGTAHAGELGLQVGGGEETRRLLVCPDVPVAIDEISALFCVPFEAADALYLNGYNSWTDSIERKPKDRMWGLTRVPRRVIDAYVLDGGGDYRFVPEDARPGHMHGFGYAYLRQGNEVLLIGSLSEDNGFTLIQQDLHSNTLSFVKEPPAGTLSVGERRELMGVAVCGGTLEAAVERWLSLAGITARPATPITGYSSWYRHYGEIDANKLASDLAGEARVMETLRQSGDLDGLDAVFQIDDGYARVGDWLEYDDARFPEGLKPLAESAARVSLVPGLWLAPFVCEKHSRLFCEHPDWVQRDLLGRPVTTGSQWSGGLALDTCNEEVRAYVRRVLRTVTRDWGFRLLKLDFLYAACLLAHHGMNRGELMADGLELLRDAVGEDVRLLLCGVPLVSAFGRCEYCRIGCDVSLDWDDKPFMRLLHRERVSTKWSLANARSRAHLDGRAFRCDPDVLFLREEGVSFTSEQRKEMLDTDTRCGGVLFTSDDMGAWDETQLAVYRDALVRFRASGNL